MKLIYLCLFLQLICAVKGDCSAIRPTDPSYENLYQQRLNVYGNAQTWYISSGNLDPDEGKRDWPALLGLLWQSKNNKTEQQTLINTEGHKLMFSKYAGSFFKPFSCPGYSMYYKLLSKDGLLPSDQKNQAKTMLYSSGFQDTQRIDHHMDPIYNVTEFNSENFHWMSRSGGYIFAEEYKESKYLAFYKTFVNNLVRATYNLGRLEWDSNNYFAYSFQPLLVLREYAENVDIANQAQAVLDWLTITAALKFMDGCQASPDVRAKPNWMEPFAGSTWSYAYMYFLDANYHPEVFSNANVKEHAEIQSVGFIVYSSYRPPQVAIDIAQRKYKTPVEMHNAKPYFNIDNDDYADWQGLTENTKWFEFETLYLERDYTLGSIASYRPDGSIGTFSEEGLWSLTVRGNQNQPGLGALQIFGNAGTMTTAEGRYPYEEIGQYKNLMVRLLKGGDNMWIAFPATIAAEQGADYSLYADLGSGVYMAWQAYGSTGLTSGTYPYDKPLVNRIQYKWSFPTDSLGALVLEVGTQEQYGSFVSFKSAVQSKSKLSSPAADQVQYRSSLNNTVLLQWQPTTSFIMYPGVQPSVVKPAGVPPKVFGDGKYIDYSTWNPYEVVSGENILSQKRTTGAPSLTASVGGKGVTISINPTTANPTCSVIS
eukprot:TRINITY_DN11788_c0_g1_i1.p1 TRINITY_DN11788_c0_g1~~TRINITY_DN11788_c0_g1_i1.p1  ORF type:complete len:652 (-),score=105.29 TRINITY_DN11788_c0_g1_i1:47-2002(-)